MFAQQCRYGVSARSGGHSYLGLSSCQDWPLYYESEQKYRRLQDIKACVDPQGLFRNKMTIPLPDNDDSENGDDEELVDINAPKEDSEDEMVMMEDEGG